VRLFGDGRQTYRLPKGRKDRTVPLAASVREALAAHLAAFPARGVTLPDEAAEGRLETMSLVATASNGAALHRNDFNRRVWAFALKTAAVPEGSENGMHALRHFFASVLLDAGESIKAVSEYLGHTDPGFTLRTYTHLMPSSAARARGAVDGVLGGYNTVTSASG
jgi:integrase